MFITIVIVIVVVVLFLSLCEIKTSCCCCLVARLVQPTLEFVKSTFRFMPHWLSYVKYIFFFFHCFCRMNVSICMYLPLCIYKMCLYVSCSSCDESSIRFGPTKICLLYFSYNNIYDTMCTCSTMYIFLYIYIYFFNCLNNRYIRT